MTQSIDQAARLFESRYDLILETAYRYAPDAGLAHDIAQQSYLSFIHGVQEKNWDLERDVAPLLRAIVKNVAMNVWKQRKKHAPEALRRVHERLLRFFEETTDLGSVEDKVGIDRLEALKSCMEKLTLRSRQFLEQHYHQGTTMEEIGLQNNVPPNTIRQMFCRLRAKLRDCIEQTLHRNES